MSSLNDREIEDFGQQGIKSSSLYSAKERFLKQRRANCAHILYAFWQN